MLGAVLSLTAFAEIPGHAPWKECCQPGSHNRVVDYACPPMCSHPLPTHMQKKVPICLNKSPLGQPTKQSHWMEAEQDSMANGPYSEKVKSTKTGEEKV